MNKRQRYLGTGTGQGLQVRRTALGEAPSLGIQSMGEQMVPFLLAQVALPAIHPGSKDLVQN
jgi:hypothetical protein